jgi:inosose dehydratase
VYVGCFALLEPFGSLERQLERLRELGFSYADVTDNHDGASLGVEYGFTASVSLDANPYDVRRLFDRHQLTPTAFCAHANLLDPSAPWRYGTREIMKAIAAASRMGIRHVITAEGEPTTDVAHGLSERERLVLIRDRLYEPLRLAADVGVTLLLEPHGPMTDTVEGMERILDFLGAPDALGVNLDTGNCWLGGGDPVAFVRRLGSRIHHVHWKDIPSAWASRRGQVFGCGMTTIPLGTGVVDIRGVFQALVEAGFDGYTTLEVAGEDALHRSREFLQALGARA